ncbi:MAG TPA: hypothetical protein VFQ61_24905, partial [Polyangiaceae bacterium]|nr:hypothetical protein [Polyangiaceae bacterium]
SVTQYVNHAVMTVFQGEQHAHRAMEACLALESHLRLRTFEARNATRPAADAATAAAIGVDSGLLIASPVGSLAHGCVSQTVLGSVVYNAARLASLANPNEILVSARARQNLPHPEDCELDSSRVLRDAEGTQPIFRVLRSGQSGGDTSPTTTVAGPHAEAASAEVANGQKPTGSGD